MRRELARRGEIVDLWPPAIILPLGPGRLGFAELDWSDPTRPAKFRPISPEDKKKYFRYTHGYGYGMRLG